MQIDDIRTRVAVVLCCGSIASTLQQAMKYLLRVKAVRIGSACTKCSYFQCPNIKYVIRRTTQACVSHYVIKIIMLHFLAQMCVVCVAGCACEYTPNEFVLNRDRQRQGLAVFLWSCLFGAACVVSVLSKLRQMHCCALWTNEITQSAIFMYTLSIGTTRDMICELDTTRA